MKNFSFFPRGIRSTIPFQEPATLQSIHAMIIGDICKTETIRMRELIKSGAPKETSNEFKSSQFYYATFSGKFTKRSNKDLVEHSGLISLDLDDVDNIEFIFDKIIHDDELNPLLVFRSPSGTGIKIIAEMPPDATKQVEVFNDYSYLIYHKYRIKVDRACKDVARACYLPYDPNAYLNPSLNERSE